MERFAGGGPLLERDLCGQEAFAGKSVLGAVFHSIAEMHSLFLQTDSLIFV